MGQLSAGLIASGGKSFDNMTEEEICASIVRLGAEVPLAYTGAFSKEFASKDMVPNTSYIVYAIPIDKEGKIGKVVYKSVTTGTPVYDVSMTKESLYAYCGIWVQDQVLWTLKQ